jgi:uncharacterized protein
MSNWQGKVVVVTGGSAGLGLAIGRAFAADGARIVLAARGAQRLEQAADSLRTAGRDVLAVPCDITCQADVERLLASTMLRFGRLDVLVNNAGQSTRGEALTTTPEKFLELLEVNFLATVRCTQAAAEQLIAQRGHLVNIGSLAAKTAPRHLGAYPASKFPVAAYSQQLRYELGPLGVHVLLVCPGPIVREDAGHRYDDSVADLPPAARLPAAGARLKGIPPDRLAQRILGACQRRSPELVVPGRARLLFSLAQLSPALGDWILGRMTS